MYQKKFIKTVWFLLSFVIITSHNPVVSGMDFGGADFMNDPEFARMLQEFEQELEKLSPEERQEFEQMVEEFTRVIEQMPPEEFDKLLDDMGKDFAAAGAANVAPEAILQESIPAPVIQTAIPDEIKQLAETLQKIKTYLSVFLVKIQIAPELPLKIDKWIKQNKITNLPNGYTWNQFSYDIEKFSTLISLLLLTDKKMNPIFLFEIHKDQALEQILANFAESLAVVPLIDIVEFGFKQEKETNLQVQQVMSSIAEVLFKEDVTTKLDLIFKTRQSEIDAKQAEALAKGKAYEPASYNFPSYTQPTSRQDFYEDGGYYDNAHGGRDFYDDYDQYYPSYSSGGRYGGSSDYGFSDKEDKSGELGKIDGKSSSGKGSKLKEEKTSEEKGKKSEEKDKEKKKDIKTVKKELETTLKQTATLLKESSIEKFEQYLKNNEIPFTTQNTLVNAEKINEKLKEATQAASDLVKLLDEEKRPEKTIKEVEEKITSTVKELQEFQQKITKIITKKENYSSEKRFGYFGDQNALEELAKKNPRKAKEMEENQDAYISITALDKKLNKLVSTLKPFIKVEEKEEEAKEPQIPEAEAEQKIKSEQEKKVETSNFSSGGLGTSAIIGTSNTPVSTAAGIQIQQEKPIPSEENN